MRNNIYMYYGLPILMEEQVGAKIKIIIFDTIFLNINLYKEVTGFLLTRYGHETLKQFLKKVTNRRFGVPRIYNVIEIYVTAE